MLWQDNLQCEGGTGENYPLEIGSHTFIPGFEEGLVGLKAGDEKELNLKFPENYVEDLKGKEVTFKVKVVTAGFVITVNLNITLLSLIPVTSTVGSITGFKSAK